MSFQNQDITTMTTNEKFFQVNLWGKLHNICYSLGSLEINLCFIMAVTKACKFTLLPPSHSPDPIPSPSMHLMEPILKLQTMYKWDVRATSLFGQVCFTKSVSVPEFELEFEYAHLNESFLSDHMHMLFYGNKNTFLFHLGNIYHSNTPKSFSKSIY